MLDVERAIPERLVYQASVSPTRRSELKRVEHGAHSIAARVVVG